MFSKRCFSEWCVRGWSGSAWEEGTNQCLKTLCFKHSFSPVNRLTSVGSRGEESEKHRLKKHRLEPLGNCGMQT